MKIFLVLIWLFADIAFGAELPLADWVLVEKSEKKLYLNGYNLDICQDRDADHHQTMTQRIRSMNIRRATPADFQEIAAIHIESWKDAYADVLPAAFMAGQIDLEMDQHWRGIEIQSQDIVLVAEADAIVGFVAVWCRPEPFIDNLHVRPSCRSHEVGSALMKAAAQELINHGHKTGYLWVFESNQKAIRFYERLGGAQTDRSNKNVFGHNVPSRKIEWEDLARILESH